MSSLYGTSLGVPKVPAMMVSLAKESRLFNFIVPITHVFKL